MSEAQALFSFATASTIHFGCGSVEKLNSEVAKRGTLAMVVTGNTPGRTAALVQSLTVPAVTFAISSEPSVDIVKKGTQQAVDAGCDVVVAIGGGSVIDAGKAISALITNRAEVTTYLEVIGDGQPLMVPPVPFIAVPTTAGTGAEVTRNAVLASTAHGVKVSMRSEKMLPDVAIVDPMLSLTVPKKVTAATGLDALTQVIEPFVSKKANPLTDAICEAGMFRAARSLKKAFDDGSDVTAREDMALCSLFGGLALANAGLGAVHGFAGPMGGMFPIPHGVACGRLLPFVFAANVAAVSQRPMLYEKFNRVARLLTGNTSATAIDGVQWLDDLCAHLGVSGLAHFGIRNTDFPRIVAAAQRASSMKGNPVQLTDDTLTEILQHAL